MKLFLLYASLPQHIFYGMHAQERLLQTNPFSLARLFLALDLPTSAKGPFLPSFHRFPS